MNSGSQGIKVYFLCLCLNISILKRNNMKCIPEKYIEIFNGQSSCMWTKNKNIGESLFDFGYFHEKSEIYL